MQEGDKIKILKYYMGCLTGSDIYVVEKFRHCLGIFLSDADREAGCFTPLCELYEAGADSELKYIPNYGSYETKMVQSWIDVAE